MRYVFPPYVCYRTVLLRWLADVTKMTASDIIFFGEVEQIVPEDNCLRAVNDDHKERIESAGSYEDLVIPIKTIPVHIMNVVYAWQLERIQQQFVDVWPDVYLGIGVGTNISHRRRETRFELFRRQEIGLTHFRTTDKI